MLGNSVRVEFRRVCQYCQILIIDYVSKNVGRETPEAHFNQVFFTLFIFSKYVYNELLELRNGIYSLAEMLLVGVLGLLF